MSIDIEKLYQCPTFGISENEQERFPYLSFFYKNRNYNSLIKQGLDNIFSFQHADSVDNPYKNVTYPIQLGDNDNYNYATFNFNPNVLPDIFSDNLDVEVECMAQTFPDNLVLNELIEADILIKSRTHASRISKLIVTLFALPNPEPTCDFSYTEDYLRAFNLVDINPLIFRNLGFFPEGSRIKVTLCQSNEQDKFVQYYRIEIQIGDYNQEVILYPTDLINILPKNQYTSNPRRYYPSIKDLVVGVDYEYSDTGIHNYSARYFKTKSFIWDAKGIINKEKLRTKQRKTTSRSILRPSKGKRHGPTSKKPKID